VVSELKKEEVTVETIDLEENVGVIVEMIDMEQNVGVIAETIDLEAVNAEMTVSENEEVVIVGMTGLVTVVGKDSLNEVAIEDQNVAENVEILGIVVAIVEILVIEGESVENLVTVVEIVGILVTVELNAVILVTVGAIVVQNAVESVEILEIVAASAEILVTAVLSVEEKKWIVKLVELMKIGADRPKKKLNLR